MPSRLTLCAFLPALLQALQPARAPPARPVSTRARATVMANSLTTISANNLKMTDNIKACGAPRPLDTARRPKPPPGGREGGRGANAAARRYVEEKIGGVVEKYAGVSQRCDTHLSVMRNPAVADSDVAEVVVFCKGEGGRAEERSPSMYSSIDLVADKVARKLRKVKERREGKRNKPQLKMRLLYWLKLNYYMKNYLIVGRNNVNNRKSLMNKEGSNWSHQFVKVKKKLDI